MAFFSYFSNKFRRFIQFFAFGQFLIFSKRLNYLDFCNYVKITSKFLLNFEQIDLILKFHLKSDLKFDLVRA